MIHTLENESEAYRTLPGQFKIQNEVNLNKGGDKFLKGIHNSLAISIIKICRRILNLRSNWLFSKGRLAHFTHLQSVQPSLN